tara:strand:+ start:135 stop:875 length:741 start_codon:yes stop_codon:yes gene_type:complete
MKADLKHIGLKVTPHGGDFHFYDNIKQEFVFYGNSDTSFINLYQSYHNEKAWIYFVKYTRNDALPLILPTNMPREVLKVGFTTSEKRNNRKKNSKEFMLPFTESEELVLEGDILSMAWIEQKIHAKFSYINNLMRASLFNYKFSGFTEVYPFIEKEIRNFIDTIEVPDWEFEHADELYRQLSITKKAKKEQREYNKWKETSLGQEKIARRKEVKKATKRIKEANNAYDCTAESASEEERMKAIYDW